MRGQGHRRHRGGAVELSATATRPAAARWRGATGVLVLMLAVLVPSACGSASEAPTSSELTVFAAASLQDVFDDLETAWLQHHPNGTMVVAHDGSNILAAQIAEGAAADVFVSADLVRPQRLVSDGDAVGHVRPFADNRIALVAPLDGAAVMTPADLARPGIRIVAAAPGVPITAYADATLARLALTMPDPATFRDAVDANVVSREDNVRAALAKVELGEGDAAFVYGTDAASSERVREVALPDAVPSTAVYGAVQVSARPLAAEFVEWLGGSEATAVMQAAGFEPASP